MSPIVIRRRKGQHYRLLASGAVSTFFVVRALIGRMNGDRSVIAIMLLLFIGAMMLLLMVNALRMVLDRRPALIIDALGVHDFISSARPGLIPWSNINGAEAKKLAGADVIAIMLRNDAVVLENLRGFRKTLAENSMKRTGTPITLPIKFMDSDLEELLRMLRSGIPVTS